ncbi:unnamed protein product [Cylindrotheca closterium]|uniref:Hpc2-related domain-containing protein n=1 Tax=Cylindrotheca closterium TaxID=2856 RepID=A0AAD2GAI0_9STRA|nr:unnamed protein product [Cylindrotheca closterium]
MKSPNEGNVEVSHRVEEDGSSVENDVEMENVEDSLVASKFKKSSKHYHHVPKIFRDSISVLVPIDVRADLKIAIQKTRQKRIQGIYKQFPSLRKEPEKASQEEGMAADEDDDEGEKAETNEKEKKIKKQTDSDVPAQVPLREQYGSVIDYLEAKYAKGVMLEDEDEEEVVDDGSGGQGSVYSEGSFLDDTGLQRDVAEQVMANTTLTKLELEEDDADFFVNVGNLEVEGNDYGENYDPTQDKDSRTAKKRKKPTASSSAAAGTKQKKLKPDSVSDNSKGKKTASSTGKKAPGDVKGVSAPDEATSDPEAAAKAAKDKIDGLFKRMVAIIKKIRKEDLPRRKTTAKVSLVCPEDKKPGDSITFANPHDPDQRLRVQVPKDCAPGNDFKVTVPVKAPEDDGVDHNKFPTEFKDLLDDYARSYDDWCRAHHVVEPSFKVFKEKQAKFEKLCKEFPSTLVTKIDSDYLKKMVRRVRQYKIKKRKKAKDQQQQLQQEAQEQHVKEEEPEENDDSEEVQETPAAVQQTINIPSAGVEFPTLTFSAEDFEYIADE